MRIGIQPKMLDPDQMNTDPRHFVGRHVIQMFSELLIIIAGGQWLALPEYSVGENSAEFPDEGAVLQQLPAQVQRDILRVHHTLVNRQDKSSSGWFALV